MSLQRLRSLLFPSISIYARKLSLLQQVIGLVLLCALFYPLATLIPRTIFLAYDWNVMFGTNNVPPFYPPWTGAIVGLLNYPALIALTLAGLGLAAYRRARHPLSFAVTFLAFPLIWTLYLGQLEGLALVGLLGLPWLAPLALIKPQVASFAFAARARDLAAWVVWMGLSFVLWGFWPDNLFKIDVRLIGPDENNIALGLWGIPLGLLLSWFSRGDPDMLMLAGACLLPNLRLYHLLVALPGMARLSPWQAAVAAVISWLSLSANWIGDIGWWTGWIWIAWVWGGLAWRRYGGWKTKKVATGD